MDDYISRQAAIDAKMEFLNPNVLRRTEAETMRDRAYAEGWNACNSNWLDKIQALPSAEPERRKGLWTPCSERLPDVPKGESIFVLALVGKIVQPFVYGYFDKNQEEPEFRHAERWLWPYHAAPDAWMPWPEPYREE